MKIVTIFKSVIFTVIESEGLVFDVFVSKYYLIVSKFMKGRENIKRV